MLLSHYVTMTLNYVSESFGSNDRDYSTHGKAVWKSYRGGTKVLRYKSLRENQLLVVKHCMRGCDIYVSMPPSREIALLLLTPIFSILQQVETHDT